MAGVIISKPIKIFQDEKSGDSKASTIDIDNIMTTTVTSFDKGYRYKKIVKTLDRDEKK